MDLKKGYNKNSEYSKVYSDFLGVDFSGLGTNISPRRLAFSQNMYRDYNGEGSGVIESVPGYRRLYEFEGRINGIFVHKPKEKEDYLIIHAGNSIYLAGPNNTEITKVGEIKDVKSQGFSLGEYFFLLDGENIFRIDIDGVCLALCSDIEPYVPVLYHNGSAFEQRNLLTDKFKEQYTVSDVRDFSYGSPTLKYAITDNELLFCSVIGIDESHSGVVNLPAKVKIGEKNYTVTQISDYAFAYNDKITEIHMGDGLKKIGAFAFRHCHYLERVYLSDTVSTIASGAFADCARLASIHLGFSMKEIEVAAFSTCPSLTLSTYSGGEEDYKKISGISELINTAKQYNVIRTSLTVSLPIFEKECKSIESVTINGKSYPFLLSINGERITAVTVKLEDKATLNGKEAEIFGMLNPLYSDFGGSFEEREKVLSKSAILGCKIAELSDGRIFLSGNPSLPNTVFYSSLDITGRVNPLYFGSLNYFSDGLGGYPVVSLLSVRDSLVVFKSGDDGSGSIFYHTPQATGDGLLPKIYPVKAVHSGFFGCGPSLSFLDDPVFLSPLGLSALETNDISKERCIVTRSHNVNASLLKEDLSRAMLTEWQGYLVLGVNGKIFLADSRAIFTHKDGSREYEWFMINPVGSYKNSKWVYRYSSVSPYDDVLVHGKPDTVANGTVYSFHDNGMPIYYVIEDGIKYRVYITAERIGGDFSPAKIFSSDSQQLYFGTDDGVVLTFNNDLYGTPPSSLSAKEDFDYKEYLKEYGGRLHPEFYSFDFHAPTYAISTAYDDCGIPHLTKNTVKNSLVLKCRGHGSNIRCEVGTDRKSYEQIAHFPGSNFSFSELDFSNLGFVFSQYSTVPVSEKERGWIEKQISVYQDEFASPLGIYSIAYRYSVKGRIKKQ